MSGDFEGYEAELFRTCGCFLLFESTRHRYCLFCDSHSSYSDCWLWYSTLGRAEIDFCISSTSGPADFPLGSLESRAAVRALLTHKVNQTKASQGV